MSEKFLGEVEFTESPIPSRCRRNINEVTVKRDGCIWRIYQNDDDPFPSNPHAHNIESGLKLDLSNGRLFFKRNYTGKSISRKNLLYIRIELEKREITLPSMVA
jgi:hypothetical protein